ncbi:hypothetical protein GUJ93_ZPchr0001g32734 [Zizania palustris]|uniref:MADS-box domain-containing protein n=1 Tax=Zizania palustris TaxID=103762 RepID=A0A8J5RZH4_ZIZPA|nr:hypothetical protein GUJ93_ZPchr0001g32734 [Zizania palustris]
MPLGKITIHPIDNNAERRSRLRKRSGGLLKKVQELSVLCNVPACVAIYDTDDMAEPIVWPSVQETTNMMQSSLDMPQTSVGKKMLDREALLQKNITKSESKLLKMRSNNHQFEVNIIMSDIIAGRRKDLDDLDLEKMEELEWVLTMRRSGIHKRINELCSKAAEASSPPLAPPTTQPTTDVDSVNLEIPNDQD